MIQRCTFGFRTRFMVAKRTVVEVPTVRARDPPGRRKGKVAEQGVRLLRKNMKKFRGCLLKENGEWHAYLNK